MLRVIPYPYHARLDESAGNNDEQNEQDQNGAGGSPRIAATGCGHGVNLL